MENKFFSYIKTKNTHVGLNLLQRTLRTKGSKSWQTKLRIIEATHQAWEQMLFFTPYSFYNIAWQTKIYNHKALWTWGKGLRPTFIHISSSLVFWWYIIEPNAAFVVKHRVLKTSYDAVEYWIMKKNTNYEETDFNNIW